MASVKFCVLLLFSGRNKEKARSAIHIVDFLHSDADSIPFRPRIGSLYRKKKIEDTEPGRNACAEVITRSVTYELQAPESVRRAKEI